MRSLTFGAIGIHAETWRPVAADSQAAPRVPQRTEVRERDGRRQSRGACVPILAVLILVGVTLRIVALASWWPAATLFTDSYAYTKYAASNPLASPQHPAGYPALLAFIGFFSRAIWVTIVLQYAMGVASALLMFATVRRLTGSAWPGLIPAAWILLNADEIYLEHTIMSEPSFVLALAGMYYAAVRAIDMPSPWWRWPAAAAVLATAATVIRSAGVFAIPVLTLTLLIARPQPWRLRWRAPAAFLGIAAALLACYATANLISNGQFEVGPRQGWHLYGRVAPFANCRDFTPPKGTERLCETIPPDRRPGVPYYMFFPGSPAIRAYGPEPWKNHDSDLGAWARKAALAQPGDYALEMWRDLRSWFVPSLRSKRPFGAGDLDPGLDWTSDTNGSSAQGKVFIFTENLVAANVQRFYNGFTIRRSRGGRDFLHDYQRVFRFGATALTIATLLCILGLFVGPRRSRVGVLLLGGSGLALLAAPTLSGYYVGRYAVPLAGPISAGAAIFLWTLWGAVSSRSAARSSAPALPPG